MICAVNSLYGSNEEFLYRGEDCMDVFVQKMIEVKEKIMGKMKENKDIIFNNNNRIDFNNATQCFVCGNVKVGDHSHFIGRYRGCAHQDCNVQFSMRYYKSPVFLHNLKSYDSHLVTERANELSEKGRIDVIAQNSEKLFNLCFLKSMLQGPFQFLILVIG